MNSPQSVKSGLGDDDDEEEAYVDDCEYYSSVRSMDNGSSLDENEHLQAMSSSEVDCPVSPPSVAPTMMARHLQPPPQLPEHHHRLSHKVFPPPPHNKDASVSADSGRSTAVTTCIGSNNRFSTRPRAARRQRPEDALPPTSVQRRYSTPAATNNNNNLHAADANNKNAKTTSFSATVRYKNHQHDSNNSSNDSGIAPDSEFGVVGNMATPETNNQHGGYNNGYSYQNMMDEPDEESSVNFEGEIFVKSASDRLRSLSAVIATHVEAYNHHEKERIFEEREQQLENDLTTVRALMTNYSTATSKMTSDVGVLLDRLNRLNDTMADRIINDKNSAAGLVSKAKQLKNMRESPEHRAARLMALSNESEMAIRTAELNARTAENVAKAMELVSEVMVSLDEIRQVAVEAKAEANLAKEQAEAERLAEEAKIREQEEARRRAEESARLREQDERRRAQEREKIAAELARIASAASNDADGTVTASEIAKNPKYWPLFVYEKVPNHFDQGISVIVRAFPKDVERTDVSVDVIDQEESALELKDGEELLSNVVRLSYIDEDKPDHLSTPLSIMVPHCGSRLAAYREPVIKFVGKSGRWREVTSTEIVLDEFKDIRFMECRLKPLGVFVVVSRIKHDCLMMSPHGCLLTSTIDPRVMVEVQPQTVRIQTRLTIKIQPVESAVLAEFKRHISFEEGEWLSGTSHFVFLSMLNHHIKQPLTLHIPAPSSTISRQKSLPIKKQEAAPAAEPQPQVPLTREQRQQAAKKPVISLQEAIDKALAAERAALNPEVPAEEDYMNKPLAGIMGKEREEEIIMVAYDPEFGPTIVPDLEIAEGKRDILVVTLKAAYHKFIFLRTVKSNNCHPNNIIKTVTKLEDFVNRRSVAFVLRQKPNSLQECTFAMTPTNRLDRVLRQFNEEGYTVNYNAASTNSPHQDIIVHEGQPIEVCMTGNLETIRSILPMKFCFNSPFKNQLRFEVQTVDKFAQKSFESFHGFVDVYTYQNVEHKIQDKESHRVRIEHVLERVKIAELVIKIPKGDEETSQLLAELKMPDTTIRAEDIIDEKLLRGIADEMTGEGEWRLLARNLGIKKSRINAITIEYGSKGPDTCCFEALLTWFKQTAKSVNKVEALTRALSVIGRPDLAENVNDLYQDFRREKSDKTAAEKTRIAFIRVCQDEQVLRSWQQLARALQISESAGETIKRLNLSTREKCTHMLNEWRSQPGSNLTILQQRLKSGGFTNAARLVRRVDLEGQ